MLRTALLLALAASLAACDAGGPEDLPIDDTPTGPAMASVAIDLGQIRAVGDCENSSSNPGDFQFKIAFVDEGNVPIGSELQFPNGAYGNNSPSNNINLFSGQIHGLNQTVTLRRPRQVGSAFGVVFSAIEWDSATTRDARMDNKSRTRLYDYRDGRFQNITGAQTLSLYGDDDCHVRLEYTISVS